MLVKVDYSPENEDKNPNVPGAYAIYTKRHFWNKWKLASSQRYAYIRLALGEARNIPPIIMRTTENRGFKL